MAYDKTTKKQQQRSLIAPLLFERMDKTVGMLIL